MAESLPSTPSDLPALADLPALSNGGAEILGALLQPRISLFWGAQAPTRSLLTAATTIAAGGLPVRLFDGGNSFDGYFVARLARQLALASARPSPLQQDRRPMPFPDRASSRFASRLRIPVGPQGGRPGGDPYDILDRMHLSRAFTCFQLAELIESAPAGPEPLFVLDLLATFCDESVPLR